MGSLNPMPKGLKKPAGSLNVSVANAQIIAQRINSASFKPIILPKGWTATPPPIFPSTPNDLDAMGDMVREVEWARQMKHGVIGSTFGAFVNGLFLCVDVVQHEPAWLCFGSAIAMMACALSAICIERARRNL